MHDCVSTKAVEARECVNADNLIKFEFLSMKGLCT